jgi:thioredoxin 1
VVKERESYESERRKMTAVTESTFEQEVLQSDKPVIVDFWAEWCGPCHAIAPVLDRIAEERGGELKVVKVNIDEEQNLAMRYGIASIPTVVLFKDLEVDSPYNTYKHAGLPPGPIASPGGPSLVAALYPANVSYKYFVADSDGHHEFRTTLSEHDSAKHEVR